MNLILQSTVFNVILVNLCYLRKEIVLLGHINLHELGNTEMFSKSIFQSPSHMTTTLIYKQRYIC